MEAYYDFEQAAVFLGTNQLHIARLCHFGELRCITLKEHPYLGDLISAADLEDYKAKQEERRNHLREITRLGQEIENAQGGANGE